MMVIFWSTLTLVNMKTVYVATIEHSFMWFVLGMVGLLCGARLVDSAIRVLVKQVKVVDTK